MVDDGVDVGVTDEVDSVVVVGWAVVVEIVVVGGSEEVELEVVCACEEVVVVCSLVVVCC